MRTEKAYLIKVREDNMKREKGLEGIKEIGSSEELQDVSKTGNVSHHL